MCLVKSFGPSGHISCNQCPPYSSGNTSLPSFNQICIFRAAVHCHATVVIHQCENLAMHKTMTGPSWLGTAFPHGCDGSRLSMVLGSVLHQHAGLSMMCLLMPSSYSGTGKRPCSWLVGADMSNNRQCLTVADTDISHGLARVLHPRESCNPTD